VHELKSTRDRRQLLTMTKANAAASIFAWPASQERISWRQDRDSQRRRRKVADGFLEDYEVGQVFYSDRIRVDRERIKTFGAEFDPPPFHLDEVAAQDTLFGGLAATGWHTAAVTMRLLVESELRPDQGLLKVRTTTFNQRDEPVQVTVANLVVPRRPANGGEPGVSRRPDVTSTPQLSRYKFAKR